jgi:hypothetical protein
MAGGDVGSAIMRSRFLLAGALVGASVGASVSASPAGHAAPVAVETEQSRRVDLDRPAAGTTNVTASGAVRLASGPTRAAESVRTGLAVYELSLAEPAGTFTATVDATVPDGAELAIDVRGRTGAGWSEWTEIRPHTPAVLPAPTRDAEVRAMLTAPDGTASPELRALAVTPSARAGAGPVAGERATYRVFATREGLVGGTTANGHTIKKRDHFAALPSRRGLSGNNGGDYSVRVCAGNGRCAWAPVWDVGPWNTRDDYWNPASVRQSWRDLPRGRPQAQAAYQSGHNGGRDQFGRRVANPAGIDLGDGTFWNGLKLSDNSWVTVTYLWTSSAPAGYIRTAGGPLKVRRGPSTSSAEVGLAGRYAQVRIECRTRGQSVSGSQGSSTVWYRLAAGKYVAAAFVAGGRGAPAC